jgi:HK97 family phage portal protein
MRFRDAIKAVFGSVIKPKKFETYREIGSYHSYFGSGGADLYASEVVRACVRTLAEHTSKAGVKVTRKGVSADPALERMIQYRPNVYMNGKDFLSKIRTLLELHNVCFTHIRRNEAGRCVGLYPLPKAQYESVEHNGRLYIRFRFASGLEMVLAWDDLAVLRKDYNTSDIYGDSNDAIFTSLDLLSTTAEGMSNAIKSTANLRGIVKSTKAMLSDEDVKKTKERFVSDYMTMSNTSGIASLDATQDFIPISLQPHLANYKNVEELRNNIYRYFGVSEDAILSKISGDDWEALYESKIEPVLLALGLELTNKIYADADHEIVFESNRMQYMSTANKLALVALVDRGAMTPNEWREVMNLAPVSWGDKPQLWQNPKMEQDA